MPQPRAAITAAPDGLGVSLDRVSFSYEPGRAVLRDVTLAVPVGATWAVVGPTGAGKTTLLTIISGLVSPTSGSVRIAGAVSGARLRRGDGGVHRSRLVFQEPFLFADTLRANIDLEGAASIGQVADALRLAQAASFVAELPGGLDTVVGERGVSLSGGQRQRIALARALASQPDVLLLDDTTSALDPTTEAHILSGLRGELAHLTTIHVASRPSTIALADTVVYLVGGRVVAVGPHHDLLQSVTGYRHLVEAYERDRGAVPVGVGDARGLEDAVIERRRQELSRLREKCEVHLFRVHLLVAIPDVFRHCLGDTDAHALREDLDLVDRELHPRVFRLVQNALPQHAVLANERFEVVAETPPLLTVLTSGLVRGERIFADASPSRGIRQLGSELVQKARNVVDEERSRNTLRRQIRALRLEHEPRNDLLPLLSQERCKNARGTHRRSAVCRDDAKRKRSNSLHFTAVCHA